VVRHIQLPAREQQSVIPTDDYIARENIPLGELVPD
jgi:hypothetical protein